MESPEEEPSVAASPRPLKRSKRSSIACRRCHSQKIKCSGEHPCRACQNTGREDTCEYPFRERKILVSERYLDHLKRELGQLRREKARQVCEPQHTPQTETAEERPVVRTESPTADVDVVNPLFDARAEPQRDHGPSLPLTGPPLTGPPFVGEAACVAFANRLLQCVMNKPVDGRPPAPNYARHNTFARASSTHSVLPDRIHAKLLIQIVLRFIGRGQHLFLKKSFMEELESVYRHTAHPGPVWLCKLFALLALGEMYSSSKRQRDQEEIPGYAFFIQAVNLLQDSYEEATALHVEVLILFSCYSNALGRLRSAYTYSGIAMRMALGLGMHRAVPLAHLSAVERESRRRTWWSLYRFDRLACSKLGQPVAIKDEDIDVALPSMDGLSPAEQEEFSDPGYFCAWVGLAKITGNILSDIYCLPGKNTATFVQRVHRILSSLRAWDAALPEGLRFHWDNVPRYVSSLHLSYNLCIIQTTRPILLYLFKSQFHLGSRIRPERPQQFSPMTTALAESCVNAARTSNKILSKLFVDGLLATFGYMDAHYIFSSTMILIISAVMEPDAAVSDAVQTAFDLLRSMRVDGNIPAHEYCDRLTAIQQSISDLRKSAPGAEAEREPGREGRETERETERATETERETETTDAARRVDLVSQADPIQQSSSVLAEPDAVSSHATSLPSSNLLTDARFFTDLDNVQVENFDALANPYINSFLAWSSNSFADPGNLQQLPDDLGCDLGLDRNS